MSRTIWTIGHSTRPIDEFIGLLGAQNLQQLIDVRAVPRSRHNPQFNGDQLAQSLEQAGVRYRHFPALGGLRKAAKSSINGGWRNASFRGYADYMQTDEFRNAVARLIVESRERRTVIMCAEAVPWRCHRSLLADALVACGWGVRHVMTEQRTDLHRLTSFAKVEGGQIAYARSADEQAPDLFE